MIKKQVINITIITALLLGLFLWLRSSKLWPGFADLFSAHETVIDETPILVTRIQSIAELMTVTSYDEIVVDSIRPARPNLVNTLLRYTGPMAAPVMAGDEIVLIAKGKVIAGLDLNELKAENLFVKEDSISVLLPPARILDIITNPSDFETFSESGSWSAAEVTKVKQKARSVLQQRALQQDILQKANNQALQLVDHFLKASGFNKRSIRIS